MNDDVHYRLLKVLEERPDASQRELAQTLGISLGRINYCVKALLDQGWIKVTNFKNSKNKLAYAYLLTPSGIDAKTRITARFLKHKIAEYEALKQEIDRLQAEVAPAKDTSVALADKEHCNEPTTRRGPTASSPRSKPVSAADTLTQADALSPVQMP